MADGWQRVRGAGIDIDVPSGVAPAVEGSIDGATASLAGDGIRLIVDRSPFADPLSGYGSRPQYARSRERIGEQTVDVVSFRADDGTSVVAARLPGPLTAVVHVAPDGDPEIAMRMLRSIHPTDVEER